MPTQKDLKRLIRSRMLKTGESYTAARSQILAKSGPLPEEFAVLAGMSDDAVRAKTGRTWRQWVRTLDTDDAVALSHREIAKKLQQDYDLPGWWAQTVTVGYERIRGLRDVGQRRGGSYDANKSKTFPVSISRLYRAFSTKRLREGWLPVDGFVIRTSTVDRSMRISWPDGTSVQAYFSAKGAEKSQVAIQHSGLSGKSDVAQRKTFWGERLAELGRRL